MAKILSKNLLKIKVICRKSISSRKVPLGSLQLNSGCSFPQSTIHNPNNSRSRRNLQVRIDLNFNFFHLFCLALTMFGRRKISARNPEKASELQRKAAFLRPQFVHAKKRRSGEMSNIFVDSSHNFPQHLTHAG